MIGIGDARGKGGVLEDGGVAAAAGGDEWAVNDGGLGKGDVTMEVAVDAVATLDLFMTRINAQMALSEAVGIGAGTAGASRTNLKTTKRECP